MPWILLLVLATLFLTLATLSAKAGLRSADADASSAWRVTILLAVFLLISPPGSGFAGEITATVNSFKEWLFLILGCLSFGACFLLYHGSLKAGSAVKSSSILRLATTVASLLLLIFQPSTRFDPFTGDGLLRLVALIFLILGNLLFFIRDGVHGRFRLLSLLSLLCGTGTILFFGLSGLSLSGSAAISLCLLSAFCISWITALVRGKKKAALDIKLRDFLLLLLSSLSLAACYVTLQRCDAGVTTQRFFLSLSLQLLAPLCFLFLKDKPSKQTVVSLLLLLLGEFLLALTAWL